MPSARKKGTKLAGAYIEDAKDQALTALALVKGYPDKASYIRALFDAAIAQEEAAIQPPTSSTSAAKKKKAGQGG